ncbi:MAG: hypothetical protein ACE5JI_04555 [Acidobacteriota bacterium]
MEKNVRRPKTEEEPVLPTVSPKEKMVEMPLTLAEDEENLLAPMYEELFTLMNQRMAIEIILAKQKAAYDDLVQREIRLNKTWRSTLKILFKDRGIPWDNRNILDMIKRTIEVPKSVHEKVERKEEKGKSEGGN